MSKQEPRAPFCVYQFFPDDSYECVASHVGPEEAVEIAKSYTTRPAAKLGIICKVIITDADDFTNFIWENGKGVTYPRHDGTKYVAD